MPADARGGGRALDRQVGEVRPGVAVDQPVVRRGELRVGRAVDLGLVVGGDGEGSGGDGLVARDHREQRQLHAVDQPGGHQLPVEAQAPVRAQRDIGFLLQPGDDLDRVPAHDGRIRPVEGVLERRGDDVRRQGPHPVHPRIADVVALTAGGQHLHEGQIGVGSEDHPLRTVVRREPVRQQLGTLLAPVAAPVARGAVGTEAVEAGEDVKGVGRGHAPTDKIRRSDSSVCSLASGCALPNPPQRVRDRAVGVDRDHGGVDDRVPHDASRSPSVVMTLPFLSTCWASLLTITTSPSAGAGGLHHVEVADVQRVEVAADDRDPTHGQGKVCEPGGGRDRRHIAHITSRRARASPCRGT